MDTFKDLFKFIISLLLVGFVIGVIYLSIEAIGNMWGIIGLPLILVALVIYVLNDKPTKKVSDVNFSI